MVTYCTHNLAELKMLLQQLPNEEYSRASTMLSSGTIGQHIRHILEFYMAVVNARDTGVVSYDNRQRELLIETDVAYAIQRIDKISECLNTLNIRAVILLDGNYSIKENSSNSIKTTVERELVYNLEHSIHHQALIKVALIDFGLSDLVSQNFGVAPSTIRNNQETFQ